MAGWADAIELEILDHFTDNGAWTPPGTLYVALFIGDPDGAGAEVSAGDYAREVGSFGAAAAGACANDVAVDYGQATSDWGTVTHFAIYSALSAGVMQCTGELTASAEITSGENVSFAIGDLTLTED